MTGRSHTPIRPIWLCRTCGNPWPCGDAKLALLAEYERDRVSLFVYLAGQLGDAMDDLAKLRADMLGSGELFGRFLSWPSRGNHAYRVAPIDTRRDSARPVAERKEVSGS
ncbi:hypothetical protein [Micromonospora sp. CB01531]|uniref:hypothetical protein n=1 Tax=Micromonospora sp. CB01531 TaxID=1718947 RepID=UPI00093E7D58|nr:hypothetical protein [Micromonospora sp. CB01531]